MRAAVLCQNPQISDVKTANHHTGPKITTVIIIWSHDTVLLIDIL